MAGSLSRRSARWRDGVLAVPPLAPGPAAALDVKGRRARFFQNLDPALLEEADQNGPGDEAADMRPHCHTALRRCRRGETAEELHQEPEAKDDQRRDVNDGE